MPWGYYVAPSAIERIVAGVGKLAPVRAWSFNRRFSSVKVKSRLYKADFLSPTSDLMVFLDELQSAGFQTPRPSSYAWPWHQRVKTPRTSKTTDYTLAKLAKLSSSMPYAWEEDWPGKSYEEKRALHKQDLHGPWNLYDLRSAYAWAASSPLPDPRTAVHVTRPSGRLGTFGLYLVCDPEPTVACPPPRFRHEGAPRGRMLWVTSEELEQLDLREPDFRYGLEFEATVDLRPDLDWFRRSFSEHVWKSVFRSFWGAWAMTEGPSEVIIKPDAPAKSRELPCMQRNPVWSAAVLARVGLRIAPWATQAAHVFVDSILVPHGVPTGSDLGDWKLVESYPTVRVTGTGTWGSEGRIIKHAGKREEDFYGQGTDSTGGAERVCRQAGALERVGG